MKRLVYKALEPSSLLYTHIVFSLHDHVKAVFTLSVVNCGVCLELGVDVAVLHILSNKYKRLRRWAFGGRKVVYGGQPHIHVLNHVAYILVVFHGYLLRRFIWISTDKFTTRPDTRYHVRWFRRPTRHSPIRASPLRDLRFRRAVWNSPASVFHQFPLRLLSRRNTFIVKELVVGLAY
jgi:hypothetical protein